MRSRCLSFILALVMLFTFAFSIDVDGERDGSGVEEAVLYGPYTAPQSGRQPAANRFSEKKASLVISPGPNGGTTVLACDVLFLTVASHIYTSVPLASLPCTHSIVPPPIFMQATARAMETRGPPRTIVFQLPSGLRAPPVCLTRPCLTA